MAKISLPLFQLPYSFQTDVCVCVSERGSVCVSSLLYGCCGSRTPLFNQAPTDWCVVLIRRGEVFKGRVCVRRSKWIEGGRVKKGDSSKLIQTPEMERETLSWRLTTPSSHSSLSSPSGAQSCKVQSWDKTFRQKSSLNKWKHWGTRGEECEGAVEGKMHVWAGVWVLLTCSS